MQQPSDLNIYFLSLAICPPALPASESAVLIGCWGIGKIIFVIDAAASLHIRVNTWPVEVTERRIILPLVPGHLIMRNQGKTAVLVLGDGFREL